MGVEISKEAIKTAETWVETAEATLKNKIYNTALYSEEMAVEIALKAVLLSVGIEPPKVHNIMQVIETNIMKSDKLDSKDKYEIKRISRTLLPDLLNIRQISGYTFNYNINQKDLENMAVKYIDEVKSTVKTCRKIVERRG